MKKCKGWLYLPVEIKVREMDAKLLLAYYAAKEGYQVIIGEHRIVELASTVYPRGIFFSKGYPRGFRKRILTNAKNNGHTVVELDEEGLLINDTTRYLHDRMMMDMFDLVTQEYCWGSFQREVITGAFPDKEHKCYIVGNPRFDLLTSKYKNIYKEDVEHIKNNYGEFVLINTRFSTYNSLSGMKKDNIDSMYFKKLYNDFVELTKAMCQKFPDTHFVIRPHPGEDPESYHNEFSSNNNVHVIHEGNIIKWLMAAKVVIHNGCTSSIEAFLLGKTIISYIPATSNDHDVILPNQLGIEATNIKEVNTFLHSILNNNNFASSNYIEKMDQNKKILLDYYELTDKKFSYESIFLLLNSIQLPAVPNHFSPSQKTLYVKENKKVKHFFPSLSKEEIQNFFRKIDEVEGNSSSTSIKMIGIDLFEIKEDRFV
ncbi:surface carbohydrate biosynthesis protein [Sporosarcina soli]|uniref:Surface carbohydrate biosynthesis protein n=1 Tax=Sporosarcina soli TaxID=334736 RepID=A0ABW0TLA5_9BACL